MYNYLMPTSLETQEIMVAFAIDNKDNVDSWGKYILEELQGSEYLRCNSSVTARERLRTPTWT